MLKIQALFTKREGNPGVNEWMNILISIGCIIRDQLYSPLWPYETTNISKKILKN